MTPKLFSHDFIIPNLLVLPMVTHWLLPSGVEHRMYFDFAGLLCYLPNFFYLLYLITYKKLRIPPKVHKVKVYVALLLFMLFYVLVRSLGDGFSFVEYFNVLLGNLAFIYIPLLFLLFPIDSERADNTKYLMCFSLVFISLQVILYGLGIMSYTSATGDDLTANEYDIGGVFRVSTTVGASTGTGLIIAMLGMLVVGFYKLRPFVKFSLLILTTITLFFTLSRGPILLWLVFICIYFFRLVKSVSFKYKFIITVLLVGSVYFMDIYGVFNPLKERIEYKKTESTDITSGRGEFYKDAISIVRESDYLGVGSGKVFPEKHLVVLLKNQYSIRMHNTYLVYLAELGLLGGLFYLLFYLFVLAKTDFRNTLLGWGLLLVLIINYNLEAVFVYGEYIGLVMFIILLSQKWNINAY